MQIRNYSNSTNTNQFCLVIILCRVHSSFDYLMYPYYPAYILEKSVVGFTTACSGKAAVLVVVKIVGCCES